MTTTPRLFSGAEEADGPAPEQYLLPTGEIATLELPDIYGIMSQIGNIPDPITASVIVLLNTEGNYFDAEDARGLQRMAHQERGKYGIYALCRTDKKLDVKRKRGDGDKILGRLDVRSLDLDYVYYSFFRNGSASPLPRDTDPDVSGGVSSPVSAVDNVSEQAPI